MTKTELIKTFEDLIEKKAVLLSPYGTHWTPEIHYADGDACVVFSNTSIDDETIEFLFCIGEDTYEINANHIKMNGSDGWGSDDTLDGQFYIPFKL